MSSQLTFRVYSANNQSLLGTLESVIDGDFVDEFNGPGFGSVTVPTGGADQALLEKDKVVRVVYEDGTRFAFVIETIERSVVNPNGQRLLTAAGRGILAAWLEDAIVYPQAGLADFATEQRPFNFASKPGGWRASGNYTNASGVTWRNDSTARKGFPVRWKDPLSQWIWRGDPEAGTQSGNVNWMYRDFTLTEPKRIRFYASADNWMKVYLDGNEIMSSSDFDDDSPSFTQMARFATNLGAGTHTLAVRVRNGRPWTRYDCAVDKDNDTIKVPDHGLTNGTQVIVLDVDGADPLTKGSTYYLRKQDDDTFKLATTNSNDTIVTITKKGNVDLRLKRDNTAGFILTALEINSNGKETDSVVIRTDTTWQASNVEPFWRPALILRTLIEEAAARGVYRLPHIGFDFSTSAPSSGSWSTEVDLTLKVGSDLQTVLDDMVDLGIDFWLHPSTLRLSAWESRGSDKSATVTLERGVNLMGFSSKVERPIKTVAVVRNKGGWLRIASESLREANGWRETFLEFGNITSDALTKRRALRYLNRTGKPQMVASGVEVLPITGTKPYVHFDVGDLVTIPSPAGGGETEKARVLSIAMKTRDAGVSFQTELEVITT